MKYLIAICACAAEGIVYAIIGASLGWKNAGGLIPMLILFAIWGATWTAITKKGTPEGEYSHVNEKTTYHNCPNCGHEYKTSEYSKDANLWLCSACKAPVPKIS